MSKGYQHFKAVLAELKSKASQEDGIYVPESENPLLVERGAILVSQKDVRRLDVARAEFALAMQKIESAKSALKGFTPLSLNQVEGVQTLLDSYNSTINDIVTKAYQRRREAAMGLGVAA